MQLRNLFAIQYAIQYGKDNIVENCLLMDDDIVVQLHSSYFLLVIMKDHGICVGGSQFNGEGQGCNAMQ